MSQDPWDLGGGGESFQFDRVGATIEGYIENCVDRQGTDIRTGEPAWWDEARTRPKMLKVLTLQTTLRDNPADDGKRNVTLAGPKSPRPDGGKSKLCAALAAVREGTGGSTGMQQGAWFKMTLVAEGPKTNPAYNPPKYYEAWYRPPVMDLDGNNHTPPANQLPPTYGQPAPGANWPAQNPYDVNEQRQLQAGAQQPSSNWVQPPATGLPISRNLAENLDLPDAQQYPAQAAPPPRQPDPGTVAQGGTLAGDVVTAAQVQAIRNAGMKPETVFGADWRQRLPEHERGTI